MKIIYNMQTLIFPIEIVVPAEVYGTVTAFRRFHHRLAFTIRRPDLLAQELCARGVIDQSTMVSAWVYYSYYC